MDIISSYHLNLNYKFHKIHKNLFTSEGFNINSIYGTPRSSLMKGDAIHLLSGI